MRSWYRNIPIGLVIAIGLAIYGVSQVPESKEDSTTRSDDGKVIEAGEVGFERLRIGDCVQNPTGSEIKSVTVVSCADLHHSEVFSSKMLSSSLFPGKDALNGELSDFCYDDLVTYTGLQISKLYGYQIFAKVPSEQTWSNGDRMIFCFASLSSGEKLSASIRG